MEIYFHELQTATVSGRNEYLQENKEKFINGSIKNKLIGIGFIENKDGEVKQLKLTEMDYFDLLFCNGIVGMLIFAFPIIVIGSLIIYKLVKKERKIGIEEVYSVSMAAIIAFLAGHVLVAPAVSIYIVIIVLRYYFENEEDKTLERKVGENKENEENSNTGFALVGRRN